MTATARRIGVAERRARLGRPHYLDAPARAPCRGAGPWSRCTRPTRPRCSCPPRPAARPDAPRSRTRSTRTDGDPHARHAAHDVRGPGGPCAGRPGGLHRGARRAAAQAAGAPARGRASGTTARWLAEPRTLRALAARGAAPPRSSPSVPRLRDQVGVDEGKAYGGRSNVTTPVLFLLAAEGGSCAGRPRGSWMCSQYQLGADGGMARRRAAELPPEDAQAELVRRWLAAFGPGTVADLKWWTGSPSARSRALARLARSRSTWTGDRAVLPDDRRPVDAAGLGGAAAGPGPDGDGLGGPVVVSRPAPLPCSTVGQHRADRVVRRPHRGRLGAAGRRRGRLPAARGRRAETRPASRRRPRVRPLDRPGPGEAPFRTPLERELIA